MSGNIGLVYADGRRIFLRPPPEIHADTFEGAAGLLLAGRYVLMQLVADNF